MAYEMSTTSHRGMGSQPFNHSPATSDSNEYDRLRKLASREAEERNNCLKESRAAYSRGDGASAKRLSDQGKEHGAAMEGYNKQASEYIFRVNNTGGKVPADTIDLHGQFVEEAEDILEARIKYDRDHGQTHLHVIVGKGIHSPGHIQKIKPRVEQVCRELGLQYHTEPNEGRIYVNLTGGQVDMGAVNSWDGYNQNGNYGGGHGGGQQQQHHQQQQYQQHQQHQQQPYYSQPQGQQAPQQSQGNNDEVEKLVKKFLPRLLRKLQRMLCN